MTTEVSTRPRGFRSCTSLCALVEELIDVGVDVGIVKKSGAWFTYEGEQLGQGRENAKQFLLENAELMVELNERVRQQVGMGSGPQDVPLGAQAGDDEPISLKD